jgi:hypothetical protein
MTRDDLAVCHQLDVGPPSLESTNALPADLFPSDHDCGVDVGPESALRHRLRNDPNDGDVFAELADLLYRRALAKHPAEYSRADTAWALSEELAQHPKAWHPLIELARLSIRDDPKAALRRLALAADRDPSGQALAMALALRTTVVADGLTELQLRLRAADNARG